MEKQEINNAISEHAMWKFNLHDMIRKGRLEKPVHEPTDSECEFGKWFYGPTVTPRQKSSPFYKRVKQLHIDFHKAAAKVATHAAQGEKDEADKLMEIEGEFSAVSNSLVEALIKWRENV